MCPSLFFDDRLSAYFKALPVVLEISQELKAQPKPWVWRTASVFLTNFCEQCTKDTPTHSHGRVTTASKRFRRHSKKNGAVAAAKPQSKPQSCPYHSLFFLASTAESCLKLYLSQVCQQAQPGRCRRGGKKAKQGRFGSTSCVCQGGFTPSCRQ